MSHNRVPLHVLHPRALRHSISVRRATVACLALALGGAGVIGCSADTTNPASLPLAKAYWSLQLNVHAINLSLTAPPNQILYDTVQLTATPRNVMGAALPLQGQITYSVHDSNVTVSPTGLVTARYLTRGQGGTQVIATLVMQGVKLADTAFIRVTQGPFPSPLSTFSVQPLPLDLDSTKNAIDDFGASINNGNGNIPAYATDTQGDSLCSADVSCQLLIHWTSSDTLIATIDNNGTVTPYFPGPVTFYAETMAYGVIRKDSLAYRIGNPIYYNFLTDNVVAQSGSVITKISFSPQRMLVGGGGTVYFELDSAVDIIFTDSVAAGGNIHPGDCQHSSCTRVFPVDGVYPYTSHVFGASGTIVVEN